MATYPYQFALHVIDYYLYHARRKLIPYSKYCYLLPVHRYLDGEEETQGAYR